MAGLDRALAALPHYEPPAGLAARAVAAARRRNGAIVAVPTWWSWLLGLGAVLASAMCLWLIAEALATFEGAGGGDLLDLIGSNPYLLWSYPADTALALLEAVPVANLVIGLASALLACLLGAQIVATATGAGAWFRPSRRIQ